MTKDIFYLSICILVIFAGWGALLDAKHKSSWCDTLYNEYRKGL